ncbi:hypothetical protein [Candidatus Nanohalobium constans]|nr:hypothetical protein [Candidatus Nanohalobium constans]
MPLSEWSYLKIAIVLFLVFGVGGAQFFNTYAEGYISPGSEFTWQKDDPNEYGKVECKIIVQENIVKYGCTEGDPEFGSQVQEWSTIDPSEEGDYWARDVRITVHHDQNKGFYGKIERRSLGWDLEFNTEILQDFVSFFIK